MNINNSKIDKIDFKNHTFFIKRDDLLDEHFSGNKARKFAYFLENDFPNINKIISYGSNQSNAMYSLSVLSQMKSWKFEYVSEYISSNLQQNPCGNYKYALENGMTIYSHKNRREFALSLKDDKTLFIEEGGAVKEARYGIQKLADEIKTWAGNKKIDIFLPSGTGTTALFLQEFLEFDVYTTACVGDDEYLKKQFLNLAKNNFPKILKTKKKYHFGALKKELFEMHKELKEQTNIEFDLLYDSVGWIAVFENLYIFKNPILYIHQGGIKGNESMLQRYSYKGII